MNILESFLDSLIIRIENGKKIFSNSSIATLFNLSGLNRFHPRWGRVNFWTRKGSKRRIIPKEKGVKKGETKKFARQRGREIKKGWINELGCASVEITRPEASVAPFPRTRQRRPLLSRYFLSLGQFLSKRRRSPFFLQFSPGIR